MTATDLDLLAAGGSVFTAEQFTAGQFAADVDDVAGALDGPGKRLVAIHRPRATRWGLAAYAAALRQGHTVCFVDGISPGRAATLRAAFDPDVVAGPPTGPPGTGWNRRIDRADWVLDVRAADPQPLHPELALLMWSSGSTAAPKAVRLSYANLAVNGRAIATATGIGPGDRVSTSLPLDFTFGLSMVNSHLLAGASVALTEALPSSERFWYDTDTAAATAVGLVPASARNLLARRWSPARHPALRRLLLSGGALEPPAVRELGERLAAAGGALLSMYGQAEVTARISCLPPDLLAAHPGSVGVPVPGQRVGVVDGEICVEGPHVMLGYGRDRHDLAAGDECGGRWRTGDRGRLMDGLLYVDGRLDRHAKILGRGVDLDEAERVVGGWLGAEAAATARDDRLIVLVALSSGTGAPESAGRRLAEHLDLPPAVVAVRAATALPRTGSGKIDYPAVAGEGAR